MRARSSAARGAASTRTPRSWCRPKTTSSCAAITHHQPQPHAAHDRADQLRRSGARARRGRRGASGLQQAVRADRNGARQAGDRYALAGRARDDEQSPWMFHLMAVHGADVGRDLLRNRSRALHRSRPRPGAIRCAMRCRRAVRTAKAPCSIRSSRSACRIDARARTDGDDRLRLRRRATTAMAACALIEKYRDRRLADRVFDLAWTHSQVCAAADQREPGRRAAVRAPGRLDHLCEPVAARRSRACSRSNRRGQSGLWGYCDLRRPADRAAAASRPRAISSSCASSCRRMRTGG